MKRLIILILLLCNLVGCSITQDDIDNGINYLEESMNENFNKDWSHITYEDVGIILNNSLKIKYPNYSFKQTSISQKWSDSPFNVGNYYTINYICDQFPDKEFSVKLDKKNNLMLDEFPIVLYENSIKQDINDLINEYWENADVNIEIDNLFTQYLYNDDNINQLLSNEEYDLTVTVNTICSKLPYKKSNEISNLERFCKQVYDKKWKINFHVLSPYFTINIRMSDNLINRKKLDKLYVETNFSK